MWTVKDIVILSAAIGCVVMIIAIVVSFLCEFHMERRIEREEDKALLLIRYATNALKEVNKEAIEESKKIGEEMFKDIK